MRIVRAEYKEGHEDGRPFIIISNNIPVNSGPPDSMYSLICYMLLTAKEDRLRIFENTRSPGNAGN